MLLIPLSIEGNCFFFKALQSDPEVIIKEV